MEELKEKLKLLEGKILVDEESLKILEAETVEIAKNVNKLTIALLETPVNGYKNVPDALHNISKTTEGLRDRYAFWHSLSKLKQRNKILYYIVSYLLVAGIALVILVHINALLHPFGYGVDFISSAKQQKVVLIQDSTKVK